MKAIDILQDVEQLTNIKKSVLMKIANAYNFAIIDNIIENKSDNLELKLNIGIGSIIVAVNKDEVLYYFEPSSSLENGIISGIVDDKNVLEDQLVNSINKHIYRTYKDMLE